MKDARKLWDQGINLAGLINTPVYQGHDLGSILSACSDTTKMKIVRNGISSLWEDAVLAADNGIDAIIVSNHGARSEDSGMLDHREMFYLPEIAEAVTGASSIIVGSGFRRGLAGHYALCRRANAALAGLSGAPGAAMPQVLNAVCFELGTVSTLHAAGALSSTLTLTPAWCAGRDTTGRW